MSRKNKQETTRVEFGNEFGDINAAKNYEIVNNDNKKKSEKKEK